MLIHDEFGRYGTCYPFIYLGIITIHELGNSTNQPVPWTN